MAKWTVLEWERNGYHDSDFYAKWYDDETDTFTSKLIGSTAYAGSSHWSPHPKIDTAPVEVQAAAHARYAKLLGAGAAVTATMAAEYALETPLPGRKVRVVKGRKVPIGTEGWVAARTGQTYGRGPHALETFRLAIQTVDGAMVWTAETNVELIDAATIDEAAIAARAAQVEAAMLTYPAPWRHYGRAVHVPTAEEGAAYVTVPEEVHA
jgi:hypothetical protein